MIDKYVAVDVEKVKKQSLELRNTLTLNEMKKIAKPNSIFGGELW